MTKIDIILSDRKTISVEIKRDLKVIVRAPKGMKRAEIERFIDNKTGWIEEHLERMRERNESDFKKAKPLLEEEIEELKKRAQTIIPPKVEVYAKLLKVNFSNIAFRSQRTIWGSCTSRGNLSFNCLLALCPDDVIDYVIIHELCHRKHMNHSKNFWAMVERYCPEYRNQKAWLKENGCALLWRLRTKHTNGEKKA